MLRHAIALVAVFVLVPAAAGQQGSLDLIKSPRADAPLQIVAAVFNGLYLPQVSRGVRRRGSAIDPALRQDGRRVTQSTLLRYTIYT